MGLVAPWFLLGFVALGVPLYLHLLRRNSSTPRPFSSLIFFEPRTLRSVRHRRLRYLLLLALRLALLTLVVLSFAQPFINRRLAGAGAERLQLLLIDHSFSMRAGSRMEDAKREALTVLSHRGVTERAQIMAFSSQLQVLTPISADAAGLRSAVNAIQADDSRGNLGEVLNAVREASGSLQSPIVVHLFSDLQQSNLPSNLEEMSLPEGVTLVLHPVVHGEVPNWTVESVTAPGQLWGSVKELKPVQVQAIIAGHGTPEADRRVSVIVNGKSVATQTVHVLAGGRVGVSFALPPVPYGFSRCEIRIDSADELPADDGYRFAIERSDPQQVLLVHAATDLRSPLYIGDALAAAGGSAYVLRSMSVGQAAQQALKPYAFVMLSNPGTLPASLESELQRYVGAGGGVLVALGTGAGSPAPAFGESILESHNYSGGFAAGHERFLAAGEFDAAQPWAGDAALWSGVKIFYVQRVEESRARVLVRLTDRTPLLLEKRIGDGRVLLLASGLEGLTNDLPLHPSFVALIAQWAAHLSSLPQGSAVRIVDSLLQLHTAEQAGSAIDAGVEVIDPAGHRPLSLTEAATAPSVRLSEAGFYQLRLANGRQQLIAVNVDPRESDLSVIPDEVLALWQRRPSPQVAAAENEHLVQARQPYALWWFILILALVAALAQSWVAARHLGTPREQT